jgi:hypothetical protein
MSIYHLHIPRTSGGSLRKEIINNSSFKKILSGHNTKISLDDFKSSSFISGHYGIGPARYSKKTFTILRDPNELTYSYIKYLTFVPDNTVANEKSLVKYLNNKDLSSSVTNVISKFLTLDTNIEKYNSNIHDHITMANNSWFLKQKSFSENDVISSILKNNIKIFYFNDKDLYQNIGNFLNIDIDINRIENLNVSIDEDSHLYEKYFDKINSLNNIDNAVFASVKSLV